MPIFRSKHFSLTYPRCNAPLAELLDAFKQHNFGTQTPCKVIVCHELHDDGTPHRHALVSYPRVVTTQNPRAFDILGFHPNIQKTSNLQAWINYLKKDGDFLEWDSEEGWTEMNLVDKARAMDPEQFFNFCLDKQIPGTYYKEAKKLASDDGQFLSIHESPCEFVFPEYLSNFCLIPDRTNILIGPAGIGKTLFLLTYLPKPILFVSHVDDIAHFNKNLHRSVLFDDVSFKHLPRCFQIQLVDRFMPRSIHRRYGTTLIPNGTYVAISGNEDPVDIDDPAILRRVHYRNILCIQGSEVIINKN